MEIREKSGEEGEERSGVEDVCLGERRRVVCCGRGRGPKASRVKARIRHA